MLREAERHPVTAILCVGAIAATLAGESGRSIDHLVISPLEPFVEPWRYLTTVFPHGGLIHIVFNLFWIWQLGQMIESRMGSVRTAMLAALTAVAGTAAELLFYNPAIGLSGVVYGMATFLWARGRHDPRYGGCIDKQTLQLLIGWFFLCIVATETGFMRIANGAHAGGAIVGFLLGIRRAWLAPVFLAALGAAVVFRYSDSSTLTAPDIHLHRSALSAMKSAEYQTAADLYDELLKRGDQLAGTYNNHAIALEQLGRFEEAMDSWIRAYEIEPQTVRDMGKREQILRVIARRQAAAGSSSTD